MRQRETLSKRFRPIWHARPAAQERATGQGELGDRSLPQKCLKAHLKDFSAGGAAGEGQIG
ncbi:MAG TPA: hypothetical protein DDZ83_12285 [Nitrospinae bacterium]|nr:hypothetical protein [Nitrospinota bacterium]